MMAEVLQERLGLAAADAEQAVKVLERAHSIRYVEGAGGGRHHRAGQPPLWGGDGRRKSGGRRHLRRRPDGRRLLATVGKAMLTRLQEKYPDLAPCLPDIASAADLLINCYRGGGQVLICGNGGSASDSEHVVGELMKGYLSAPPRIDRGAPGS